MDIVQEFYDNMAPQYEKLFADWQAATEEQAVILDRLFKGEGVDKTARILDCACGIGTQSIGLASLGYSVTASDISRAEIEEAKRRAESRNVKIRFEQGDFCALKEVFKEQFDIVIAMDNAPHAFPSKVGGSDKEHSRQSPQWRNFRCKHQGLRRITENKASLFPSVYPQNAEGKESFLPDMGLGGRQI